MRETSGGAVFARHARGAALLAVAMMLVAPAVMAARGDRDAAAEPATRSAPVVRNTVDELKQLMDARQLTELRTTYTGKRYTERLVAYNEERLRTLQQEMEQQQAQSAQVSAALQQAQQQAVSLSSDVQSTNSQLDALQPRIQILQAEQGNPELSLPKPDSVPSPAPAAASDGR